MKMRSFVLKNSKAVANQGGAMGADTISKNGASLKSRMSRGNYLIKTLIQRFLLVVFATVLTASYAQAQTQLTFGPRLGVNFTNKRFTTAASGFSQSIIFKMKQGFQIGGIAEITEGEKLVFQTGLFISTQKCIFDRIETSLDKIIPSLTDIKIQDDVTLSLTYIRYPMYYVFKKDLGGMTFLAFGGTYLGLAVAGKIQKEKLEFGKIGKGFMSRLDYGLNLGPGLQFGNFQAAIEYSIGFCSNSKSIAGVTVSRFMLNNGFALNLTYLFGNYTL